MEYSSPEFDDRYFTPYMMASNIKATNTMPTMKPLNVKDRYGYEWDVDEPKFAEILSRSQAESSNSPKMAKK